MVSRSKRTNEFTRDSFNRVRIVHNRRITRRKWVYFLATTLFSELDRTSAIQTVLRDTLLTAGKGDDCAATIYKPSAAGIIRHDCQAFASNSSVFIPWYIKHPL